MSLAIGYVLQAAVEVAGDEPCPLAPGPGQPDLTVAELAHQARTAAQDLLRTAGPGSTLCLTGDDPAATVRRLGAAVIGLVITDDPARADLHDVGDPPASVEAQSTQVWSDSPLLLLPDGSTVRHGAFLASLEKLPPLGWPQDLLVLVRDLNRLGRWAPVRDHLASLPDIKQHDDPRGTRWCVHNRLVARIVDETTLLVRCDFADRERLLTTDPETFSVRPNLESHQKVLADVAAGNPAAINAAVTAAWELQR